VGQRLRIVAGAEPEVWRTVVGVVGNVVQQGLSANAASRWAGGSDPLVYFPYRQRPPGISPSFTYALVRTSAPLEGLTATVRRELQVADPDLPVSARPLSELIAETYRESSTDTVLLLVFASIAVLLASAGLSAVIAYAVSHRTKELGIRIAIGATKRDIVALVVRQGIMPVGIGLIVGWLASFGVTRLLTSLLIGVEPADPTTFIVAPVVLMLAAAAGLIFPVRRATRLDPIVALHHD
jgi:hypothetical protein